MREVVLTEWGRVGPRDEPALRGLWPDDPAIAADLASLPGHALNAVGVRDGLSIQARQHVGVIRLGPLQVRIRPKLPPADLWSAVAWAFGLDALAVLPPADPVLDGDFVDTLGALLLAEAERLRLAGIQRGYVREERWLTSPRGRPDLAVLARHQPLTRAALPCRAHALSADIPANQVVVGGLDLARRSVASVTLRSSLHRAWQQWAVACGPVRLDAALIGAARRATNRLTSRYEAAHAITQALYAGTGLGDLDDADAPRARLPGFLWDMAALWEAFATRFLTAYLPDLEIRPQRVLRHLYRVRRAPPDWTAPRPRPDVVVEEGGRSRAVIDAKYRDLATRGVPREMLYQLSVYALAWSRDGEPVPAIALFPSSSVGEDIELDLVLPGGGERRVVVRGADWSAAIRALRGNGSEARRLARAWSRA